ncbi:MAG: FMN-binding negative transcriptional regulator [Burkholderiales bacterium]|nr:FMN-binding negative transcriptional regulator [Burkholderiales bacterium]
MYMPAHFVENRPEELRRLIEHNPLGALVRHGTAGLDADHLPFELEGNAGEGGRLHAHVARANPICTQIPDGAEVLVIFRAADAYVSPNWYPSKHEHHKQVPTWNYEVVHVHGRLRMRDDEKYVRGLVARLTRIHENRTHAGKAWRMSDAPRDYIDTMLMAVVGIEVEITRVVGKAKVGQNREARDRLGAADALAERGQHELASAMRNR